VVTPRRIRWAGHVALMEEQRWIHDFGGKTGRNKVTWKF